MIVLPTFALLTGIIAAAIMIAARATVTPESASQKAYDASLALQTFSVDVASAIGVVELTTETIELIVPDRTGNGDDDRIRYAWSGNTGDPLMRVLNAQPAQILVPDVHAFTLSQLTTTAVVNPLDEEFAVLAYHDGAPGGHTHDHTIEPNKLCAQYFEPSLPGGTTEWKIKRIRFMAKREGSDTTSVLNVRIESADLSKRPTGIVLDEAFIAEIDLDGQTAWVDVDFTSLNELDPADGLCLVIGQSTPGEKAANVQYEHGGNPMSSGTHWLKSEDGGSSWSSVVNDKDMRFYVFGTYDAYVPAQRQYLMAVQASLQPGPDSAASVGVTASLLNPLETSAP